jgi:hypothetical protein
MKKGVCEKCGETMWLQEHHVPPKASKIQHKLTYSLCPNCHVDFHQYLGMQNLKNTSEKYHLKMFYRWLLGVALLTLIIYFNVII